MEQQNYQDKLRMAQWLFIALAFYAAAMLLAHADALPRMQTVMYKLGHQTIAAHVGYWIDRSAFRKRISCGSHPLSEIRRAIVMAACMLAVALGL